MVRSLLLLCSLLAALPARAVTRTINEGLWASNNAVLVSTKTGNVYVRTAGTMTVSGNAFSVGTTSFTVAGGSATVAYLMTARAFAGDGSGITGISASESNTYTSSKTFTSNVLAKASVTASGFFGDGSGLTNLPSTVAQSTVTNNLTGSTTETTNFKLCYASGTLTTGGSAPVQVHYSGSITASGAAGHYCVLNILQDGAFISPYSSTVGMGAAVTSSAGGFGNATMVKVFPAPSAGSHSWCLSMISPFGDTCTFTFASAHGNQFGVTELR